MERLTAENLRLAGEVSNRNSRALAGDTATKQFDAMYEDIERLTAERDALRAALHSISLASQDSGSTKEGMGLYARAAIAGDMK